MGTSRFNCQPPHNAIVNLQELVISFSLIRSAGIVANIGIILEVCIAKSSPIEKLKSSSVSEETLNWLADKTIYK